MPVTRVLLIDDDEDTFIIVKRILSRPIGDTTFSVDWCSTYKDALDALQTGEHDVCLLDYRLGADSGLALLNEARPLSPRLSSNQEPIILLTAHGNLELDIKAMQAGVADYLVKSELDERLLERAIRYAMERSRLLEQVASSSKLAALGELSASIAHEVNNPITSILGAIHQLKAALGPKNLDVERVHYLCDIVERSSYRIASIIKALYALAGRGPRDQAQTLQIRDLLDDALALCRERLREAEVELIIPESDESICVHCRPVEISQVLFNLISNSIDAISHKQPRWIKIDIQSDRRYVAIGVTDSGDGIPKAIRNRIMKSFFTTKKQGRGSGLGLSISKEMAVANGGSLALDDDSQHTRFVLNLPATGL